MNPESVIRKRTKVQFILISLQSAENVRYLVIEKGHCSSSHDNHNEYLGRDKRLRLGFNYLFSTFIVKVDCQKIFIQFHEPFQRACLTTIRNYQYIGFHNFKRVPVRNPDRRSCCVICKKIFNFFWRSIILEMSCPIFNTKNMCFLHNTLFENRGFRKLLRKNYETCTLSNGRFKIKTKLKKIFYNQIYFQILHIFLFSNIVSKSINTYHNL